MDEAHGASRTRHRGRRGGHTPPTESPTIAIRPGSAMAGAFAHDPLSSGIPGSTAAASGPPGELCFTAALAAMRPPRRRQRRCGHESERPGRGSTTRSEPTTSESDESGSTRAFAGQATAGQPVTSATAAPRTSADFGRERLGVGVEVLGEVCESSDGRAPTVTCGGRGWSTVGWRAGAGPRSRCCRRPRRRCRSAA